MFKRFFGLIYDDWDSMKLKDKLVKDGEWKKSNQDK